MLTLRRLHIAAAALLAATLDDTSLAHNELRQESTAHATHTWRWEPPGEAPTHFVALRHSLDDVRVLLLDGEEARRWPSSSMRAGQRLPLHLDKHEGSLVVAQDDSDELGFSLSMPGGVFASSGTTSVRYRGCGECMSDSALESASHFIHIPKCAGTTIEEVGCSHGLRWGKCSARAADGTADDAAMLACSAWHRPLQQPRLRDGAPEPSFCVMREPFDRILSEFRFRVTRGDLNRTYDTAGLSAWLSELRMLPPAEIRGSWDCHFILQSEFMLAAANPVSSSPNDSSTVVRTDERGDGEFAELCTHVLDFAHLERDFDALMRSEPFSMPITLAGFKRNVSPKSGAATSAEIALTDLSSEAREWVEERYRMDFEMYDALRRRGETSGAIAGALALLSNSVAEPTV
jgi:hypothetical protein